MVRVGRRPADDGTDRHHGIQTVLSAGSFAPLRSASKQTTASGRRRSAAALAEKLQQEGSEDGHGVVFPAELVRLLDRLEEEIRADRVSSESRAWLAQCGLTVEQLAMYRWSRNTHRREKVRFTTATTGDCRWRLSAKTAIRRGAGSMMNGRLPGLMKRTRITCTSRTVCQGSSMMRNQGCTITVTGSRSVAGAVYYSGPDGVERGMEFISVSFKSTTTN